MSRMKYIRFADFGFVIFPAYVKHSDMAQKIGTEVLSAGFVDFTNNGNLHCYGESISLGATSLMTDSVSLQDWLSP